MNKAYIALGSNLGDRCAFLKEALLHMSALGEILSVSSLYETAPIGFTDQPNFLNGVLLLETALSPITLLEELLAIEELLGRTRDIFQGPRTLDLDLLFYNDLTMSTDFCTLPHPRVQERSFVLTPLMEIAPHYLHPLLQCSITDLHRLLGKHTGVTLSPHTL